MHLLNLLLSSLWLSTPLPTPTPAQNPGLLVQTQQGDVIGSHVGRSTVRQFLGIPYAIADRWEAPRAAAHRVGTLDATKFGDSCFQANSPSVMEFLKLTGGVIPNVTESENCMSVNIWAPSIDRKQKTAVMVWIYGGGFMIGSVCCSFFHLPVILFIYSTC